MRGLKLYVPHLFAWNHVFAGFSYHVQIAIATANDYLTHIGWWEDRVDTFAGYGLATWLESAAKRREGESAMVDAGLECDSGRSHLEFRDKGSRESITATGSRRPYAGPGDHRDQLHQNGP